MANVMAIFSRTAFEKFAWPGRNHVGIRFHLDRYHSSHPALETLREGGSLFSARKNAVTTTDITALRERVRFDSGQGMSSKPGALAMSLQTPRLLSGDDVRLLRAAGRGDQAPATRVTSKRAAKTTAVSTPKAARPRSGTSDVLATLMQGAFTQIEDDYLDQIRDDATRVLARGDFSSTVQSIFSSAFDRGREALPLLATLAPFASGKVIASRIAAAVKRDDSAPSPRDRSRSSLPREVGRH